MTLPAIDPRSSALLCMDFQSIIVDGHAGADPAPLLDRMAGLLEAARVAGVMVVYVVVGFRPGHPEVSDNNRAFSSARDAGRFVSTGPAGADIHPAVQPRDGDVIVLKHRVSAFAGTDLDMILRARGIGTLVLGGIATSGVVLSTVRHAADADYRIVVAADCCGDSDAKVHRCLVDKVFPRQATVTDAAEIAAALS
jgi:nicotinamidase-related amidase